MNHIKNVLLWGLTMFLLPGCLVVENPFQGLPPGIWRGSLQLDPNLITPNPRGEPLPEKLDLVFEEVNKGELPFNFEIRYATPDSFYLELINGAERIPIQQVVSGWDNSIGKDTVRIDFPVFDSYIRAVYAENIMEGEWVVNNRNRDYRIPFVARYGKDYRFTNLDKAPAVDISGRWRVTFEIDNPDSTAQYPAIGLFEQEGNRLTGTFITETGDYRFLEGTVQGDRIYLSAFDGAHAFLFEARLQENGNLIGSFRSGTHYRTIWEASRDEQFQLRPAGAITKARNPDQPIHFAFPDATGKTVNLDDPEFRGKGKIVQLFGTWCPNSRDGTEFLLDYLGQENPGDVAVIALAFERQGDPAKAKAAIQRYREFFGMNYPILYAGTDNKTDAAAQLPFLEGFTAYPTFLFLDPENRIRHIYTGIQGPATPGYERFKQTFRQFVADIRPKEQE